MTSDVTFIPNPHLAAELRVSRSMSLAVAEVANRIARDAEAIGDRYGYHAEVDVSTGEATVNGTTTGGQGVKNLAGWLEFGQGPLPALAPMRAAADRNGMAVHGR